MRRTPRREITRLQNHEQKLVAAMGACASQQHEDNDLDSGPSPEQSRAQKDKAQKRAEASTSSGGSSDQSPSEDMDDMAATAETKPPPPKDTAKKPKLPTTNYVAGKIDSGCTTTILSAKTLDKLDRAGQMFADNASITSKGSKGSTYKFADGQTRTAQDQVMIKSDINGHQCEVFANVFSDSRTPFLLGLNFLRRHRISIQFDPVADRITCPVLGLSNSRLPRDRSGLSIMPFCADYHGIVAAGV